MYITSAKQRPCGRWLISNIITVIHSHILFKGRFQGISKSIQRYQKYLVVSRNIQKYQNYLVVFWNIQEYPEAKSSEGHSDMHQVCSYILTLTRGTLKEMGSAEDLHRRIPRAISTLRTSQTFLGRKATA